MSTKNESPEVKTLIPLDYPPDAIVVSEEQTVVPVVLKKKGGGVAEYELREMGSPEVASWMNFQQVRITGGKRKPNPGDSDFRQFQANLIHLCLYEKGTNSRVPIAVIDKWFAGTLSRLFDQCETMNGLNEQGKEQAKKA
jgi:hypothetical protein